MFKTLSAGLTLAVILGLTTTASAAEPTKATTTVADAGQLKIRFDLTSTDKEETTMEADWGRCGYGRWGGGCGRWCGGYGRCGGYCGYGRCHGGWGGCYSRCYGGYCGYGCGYCGYCYPRCHGYGCGYGCGYCNCCSVVVGTKTLNNDGSLTQMVSTAGRVDLKLNLPAALTK